MDREYEFFVTTDEPHQPDGPERGLIRRLVMRNFFETKWSGPTTNSSEHNSASTVQARTNLRSRFRLPKPGQEQHDLKAKAKCKTERRGSREEGERKERRPGSARKLSGLSDVSERSNRSKASSRKASPDGIEGVEGGKSKSRLVLKINPSAHRFDPFDVLPVPGSPQLDMLFKLCKHPYSITSTSYLTFDCPNLALPLVVAANIHRQVRFACKLNCHQCTKHLVVLYIRRCRFTPRHSCDMGAVWNASPRKE